MKALKAKINFFENFSNSSRGSLYRSGKQPLTPSLVRYFSPFFAHFPQKYVCINSPNKFLRFNVKWANYMEVVVYLINDKRVEKKHEASAI